MIFIGVKVLTFFTGPNKARFARAYYMIIISKNLVIMAETSYLDFMNSKLSREVIKKIKASLRLRILPRNLVSALMTNN